MMHTEQAKQAEKPRRKTKATEKNESTDEKKPETKKDPRPDFLDNPEKPITVRDIGKALQYYSKYHNNLINICKKIYSGKNGIKALNLGDGEDPKEKFNQLNKKYCQELRDLQKFIVKVKKSEKRTYNVKNRKAGFLGPKFFRKDLVDFFKEADLGPAYAVKDEKFVPTQKKLNQELELFLGQRVTSTSLLTPLFNIYIKRNKSMVLKNGQCIKFTPLMRKYFSRISGEVEKVMKEKRKQIEEQVKNGTLPASELEKVPEFDMDCFRRPRLHTLVKFLTVKTEELTDKEKDFLKNPATLARLKYEQEIVSATNRYYNENPEVLEKSSGN